MLSPTKHFQCIAMKAAPTSLSQTKQDQMHGPAKAFSARVSQVQAKAFTSRHRPTKQCRTHPTKGLCVEVVLFQGSSAKATSTSPSQTKWWAHVAHQDHMQGIANSMVVRLFGMASPTNGFTARVSHLWAKSFPAKPSPTRGWPSKHQAALTTRLSPTKEEWLVAMTNPAKALPTKHCTHTAKATK